MIKPSTSLIFCLLLSSFQFLSAQNLVPNPSFEDTIECPCVGFEGIESSRFWHNPTAYSPDYFNACVSEMGCGQHGVPTNFYGTQPARTGVAYAGIISAAMGGNLREYIQAQLTDSLKAGEKYCVSFFVCLADSSPYAVNDIGAYLSVDSIGSSGVENLPYDPQIANNVVNNPLTQRNTWIEVNDSFSAEGGERYITIGNFHDDANTDTTNFPTTPPHPQYAYYYLDDVSLNLCDVSSEISSIGKLNEMNIFPNPASDELNVKFVENGDYTFSLIDLYGTTLLHKELFIRSPNQSFSFSVQDIPNGFYLVRLDLFNQFFFKKIFVYKP